MKKSILTIMTEIKEVLEKGETIMLVINREGKQSLAFTITENSIKGVYPPKGVPHEE